MIKHLSLDEITNINKRALELTNEGESYQVNSEIDILSAIDFVKNNINGDIFKKALGYFISLFVYHPFLDGNHRVSLMSAEKFLVDNGYHTIVSVAERKKFQKWQLRYENENDLEREFFLIVNIEDKTRRNKEIKKVMKSEYGEKIEGWLRKNYKVKTNGV